MRVRHAVAGFGLSLAVGVGYGAAVENRTNEVARGKAETAETCLDIWGNDTSTISKDMEDCLQKGVPGGAEIGSDKFEDGDPIEYIDAYIDAQNHEAAQIELGRLVVWSIVPDAAAATWIWLGLS